MKIKKSLSFLAALVVFGLNASFSASLTVVPEKTEAVFHVGEKIVWKVTAVADPNAAFSRVSYTIKKDGARVIHQGTVTLKESSGTIETSLDVPGTLLTEVTAIVPGKTALRASVGAAIAPAAIGVSVPIPEDFDVFWKAKLEQLATVPENAVLENGKSDRGGVDYWKITMDNIEGTHVQGQLARPTGDKKIPALIVFQWAGVYPLKKSWVTERAAEGWLTLNIMAHDLPIDESEAFYTKLASGSLAGYTAIGNDDREKSYFLRMFLGCYRAVEYISQRPDWDGKVLVVSGGSQGGLQAFAAAALNSKATAVIAMVPAGCDNTGAMAERNPGWPFWVANGGSKNVKQVTETSRYFDGVNMASRLKCPVLIGFGLIDTTSPPSGVLAAINQISTTKEVVIMPGSDHGGTHNTQVPFQERATAWRQALLEGNPPPLEAWNGLRD